MEFKLGVVGTEACGSTRTHPRPHVGSVWAGLLGVVEGVMRREVGGLSSTRPVGAVEFDQWEARKSLRPEVTEAG